MDRGALHDALEAGGWLWIAWPVGREAGQILVQEFSQVVAQLVEIDPARLQHGSGIGIFRQAEEEMFQRCILVPPFAGERQGAVKRLFEVP